MHPSFSRTDHRPWPLPQKRWQSRQTWHDLLFAHWPVAVSDVRSLVPESLDIQEFAGSSWVGVVPFHMTGVARRSLPDIPGLSAFPELNLRLYVERDGKPGVWFLSLDATNPIAVWAARRFFALPYYRAKISVVSSGDGIQYRCTRRGSGRPVRFSAEYGPTSKVYEAKPGSLEYFLTERYCLYAQAKNGRVFRTEIHHVPWPLQEARANIEINELHVPHGFQISGPPSTLHFARRLDVVVWRPEALEL
jgi:uncharacterized protein YqjF (DUF2071 family)